MPQSLCNPALVVGAAARFQHHLDGRGLGQERLKPSPGQVLAQDRATVLIHPVQGENGLGRVNGDGGEPLHLLVDSTGLRLCGAGEWLLEKHGTKTRRS